jgi:hypothetical protein
MPATAPTDFRDDYGRHIAVVRERRAVREAVRELPGDALREVWLADAPGSPLGAGMPSGRALRMDGESHANWWRRTLRGDPCSYCGRAGGTVDHVVPKATGQRGLEDWVNLVGACPDCNAAKGAKPMVVWLAERRWAAPKRRERERLESIGRFPPIPVAEQAA